MESLLADHAKLEEKVKTPAECMGVAVAVGHDLQALRKRCCKLETENKTLHAEVAELRERLDKGKLLDTPTTSPTVTSSQEVVVSLANVRSYEDREFEDVATELGRRKVEDVRADVGQLVELNSKLSMEIAEKEALLQSSKKTIQRMTEEIVALKKRGEDTSRDLLEFEKSLSELAAENQGLMARVLKSESAPVENMEEELAGLRQENRRLAKEVNEGSEKIAAYQEQLKGRTELKEKLVKVQDLLKQATHVNKALELKLNSIIEEYHEATAELKNMRGMVDAGGGVVGHIKRELAGTKKALALRCSEMASKDGVVKRLNMELKKHLIKREDVTSGQHEVKHGQVIESLDNSSEGSQSMKEKLDFFTSQCSWFEAETKSLQEKMKEASELVQKKELQLVMFQCQEKSFSEEVKKLKSVISGEKVLLKKLKQAEDALEVQRGRLLLKDQEILGYRRKLELAPFVPQMGWGCAPPQGEAWDLSMPRVKSEYQEQDQRLFGTKRKHGVSSPSEEPQLATLSTAVDISNSPRSAFSSKEEQTKVFKKEGIPTDCNSTSPFETMNTSFSLSASSISKDEYIVEELSTVIKEEEKGNVAMWSY